MFKKSKNDALILLIECGDTVYNRTYRKMDVINE